MTQPSPDPATGPVGLSPTGPPPYYRPLPVSPAGQPLASFGERLAAVLLDGLILGLIVLAVLLPVALVSVALLIALAPAAPDSDDPTTALGIMVAVVVLYVLTAVVSLGAGHVYYVELAWRTGQTPGKRIVGVRVAALAPMAPLTRGAMAKRYWITVVAGLVPVGQLLDGLWQLWDKPYQQCLHDKVAQTVVVRGAPG